MSEVHLTPDELEAQVEARREQLAATVDQLTHKLDVQAQARRRLEVLRAQLTPAALAGFAGAAVLVGGLVWWRIRR